MRVGGKRSLSSDGGTGTNSAHERGSGLLAGNEAVGGRRVTVGEAGIGDVGGSWPVGNRRERERSGKSEVQDRKCREGKGDLAAS